MKPAPDGSNGTPSFVRGHIPLEEGLKHGQVIGNGGVQGTVRGHIPLEEGLKLSDKYKELRYELMFAAIFH